MNNCKAIETVWSKYIYSIANATIIVHTTDLIGVHGKFARKEMQNDRQMNEN